MSVLFTCIELGFTALAVWVVGAWWVRDFRRWLDEIEG